MPCTGIDVVGRLDHVVLLVAAQSVLRTERRRQAHFRQRRERIERVRELARDRGGMREQRHAAPDQGLPQGGVGDETVESDVHGACSSRAKPVR